VGHDGGDPVAEVVLAAVKEPDDKSPVKRVVTSNPENPEDPEVLKVVVDAWDHCPGNA